MGGSQAFDGVHVQIPIPLHVTIIKEESAWETGRVREGGRVGGRRVGGREGKREGVM